MLILSQHTVVYEYKWDTIWYIRRPKETYAWRQIFVLLHINYTRSFIIIILLKFQFKNTTAPIFRLYYSPLQIISTSKFVKISNIITVNSEVLHIHLYGNLTGVDWAVLFIRDSLPIRLSTS